jgi:hypothetical protein
VVLSTEQQSTVPIIDIMVVRKFKVTTNATVFIGKSRLVPRGDKIPYNDGSSSTAHLPFKPLTYAPTIPTEAKRVFFCIASAHGRDILQIDFVQAFGQPKFKADDKRYYLKVPLRYRQHGIASLFTDYLDDSNPDAVSRTTATNLATPAASSIFLRLNAYLYGLPDAARQWWLLLSAALLDLNFVQHSTWNCFFRKVEPDNSVTFLIVHVDDMLGHNSKDVSKVNEVYTAIRKTLKATDPIPLHGNLFLNVRYFRNADLSWSCSQEHYIDSIKERFPQHPISRKLPYTQLPSDFNLGPSLRSVTKEAVHQLELEFGCKFSAITGSAVYLLDTREDCRTSIVFLASHNHLPGRSHFIAAFHFLNYLYATKSLRFNFSKPYAKDFNVSSLTRNYPETPKAHMRYLFSPCLTDGSHPPLPHGLEANKSGFLEVFYMSDSEHKTHSNGKAILGWCLFFGGCCVLNRVVIPKVASLDTTSAEGQGGGHTARSIDTFVPNVEEFLLYKLNPEDPPVLALDNLALQQIIANTRQTPNPHCKPHIKLPIQLLHHLHLNKRVKAVYVYSQLNTSDINTKTLPMLANAIHTCTLLNIEQHEFEIFSKIIAPQARRAAIERSISSPNATV